MSGPSPAEPVYLQIASDPVFGLLHRPTQRASATGVLLCSPWGWDDVASYRSRRTWAQQLASAGHLTLRFDLPSVGDSAGSPEDPLLLDAWSAAIAGCADWLRANSGCARVAAVGLGLSGLIACKALSEGGQLDDLVLWAAPTHGRGFVREQRAFSRMQSSRYSPTGSTMPSALPEGWMEVGGFVLTADTVAALERLDARAMAPRGLQRALLLDRDGVGVDEELRAAFESAGVAVSVGTGNGWESMVANPERPAPPFAVFDEVSSWLAQAPNRVVTPAASPAPRASGTVVLDVEGARITESPLVLALPFGRTFGVLAQPTGERSSLCAVFVNAGAVRRTGPNRMWTEASRRWAARGVPSLRIDLEGIGDADGDGSRYRDVNEFYVQTLVTQLIGVLDELQARDIGQRFVLVGLCSGGYWAFHSATRHENVSAALLVNAGALMWDSDLVISRAVQRLDRLRHFAWWKRIARGNVKMATVRSVVRTLPLSAKLAATRVRGRDRRRAASALLVDDALDGLRDTDTRLVLAFSGDEALQAELARAGVLRRLSRWPNVSLESLPGRDHTLRPIIAQLAVHDLLDRELEHEFARELARPDR